MNYCLSEFLESWLEDRSAREQPVAAYVEEEFRGYLTCGLLCFGHVSSRREIMARSRGNDVACAAWVG